MFMWGKINELAFLYFYHNYFMCVCVCVCVYIHIYTYRYLLTQWSRVHLEKLTGLQLVKKFSAFYGARRFITAFTSARNLSLSWASSIQSIPPQSNFLKIYHNKSSHLRLVLPNGLFPSGFPTKTLYTPLISPIRATCPAHLILFLDFITRTILDEEHVSVSSSLCNFLHSPVTSSLLAPNIFFYALFSNTLSLRSRTQKSVCIDVKERALLISIRSF